MAEELVGCSKSEVAMLSPRARELIEQFAMRSMRMADLGAFMKMMGVLRALGETAANARLYEGDEGAIEEMARLLNMLASSCTMTDPFQGTHPTWWPANFLRDDRSQFELMIDHSVKPFDRKMLRRFFTVLDQSIDRYGPAHDLMELHAELREEVGSRFTLLDPWYDARISRYPKGKGSRPGLEMWMAMRRAGTIPVIQVGSQSIPFPDARLWGFDLDMGRVESREFLGRSSDDTLEDRGIKPISFKASSLRELEQIYERYLDAIAKRDGDKYSIWMRGQARPYHIYDSLGMTAAGWEIARKRIARRLTHVETDHLLIPSAFRNFDTHWRNQEAIGALLASVGAWQLVADELLRDTTVFPVAPVVTFPDDLPPEAVAELEKWAGDPEHSRMEIQLSFVMNDTDALPAARTSIVIEGQQYMLFERQHNFAGRFASGGLLLQHYGCPTGGLDITNDVRVALSFAAGRVVTDPQGRFVRLPSNTSGQKPVVYMMLLREGRDPFLKSEDMFRSTSFPNRIEEQHCGILFGSNPYCRNYAFRHVIAAVEIDFPLPPELAPEDVYPLRADDRISDQICSSFGEAYRVAADALFAEGKGVRVGDDPKFRPSYRE